MDTPYALHGETEDFVRLLGGAYRVSLKVPAGQAQAAWVRSEPDNEQVLTPLTRTPAGAWDIWEGPLALDTSGPVTRYAFRMLSGGRQIWLSGAGLTQYFPERDHHFRLNPTYERVPWLTRQVFYQIFPERFFDGDPSNNVETGAYRYDGKPVVARRWDELPDPKQGAREFFGGDLVGIEKKLPYLEDLGVTALYLNPIFTSPSSHKYDTTDYYRVDPHFGGDEAFASLCAACRARGMRVVLDAVVNHTSERHPWFDRYGEHGTGAYHSPDAPTRGFYVFQDENPESYHGWYGVRTLPVLDYAHPELRQRIYEADDAVLRHWLRPPYSIDGWRFDVIHMLGEGAGATNNAAYVRHFRQTLRQENPEALVLGEHFFEATQWLQGDQEDSAMNYYGFARPVTEFLAGRDFTGQPSEFGADVLDHLLARARNRLPFPIQLSQLNLLDSHDTPRLLTQLGGDVPRFKLAVTLLMTYIGVPCVYYGDEIGLPGGRDPDCRRPFPWDEAAWDHDLRAHFRALIALRRRSRTLQEGAYLTLHAAGDAFAFARFLGDDLVVVALNRGEGVTLELPLWKTGLADRPLTDALTGAQHAPRKGVLRLALPETGGAVLVGREARED
jgi:alpha-glucosidase